jgi:hypothetical protein
MKLSSDPMLKTLLSGLAASKQNHANSTSLLLVRQIPVIHAASYRRRPPIVQVVMKLSVTGAELEVL